MQPESETPSADFAMMSEDEQIAYAMRMSLQAEGVSQISPYKILAFSEGQLHIHGVYL